MWFSFDGCVLDANIRELSRDGVAIRIEPQVFDLLLYLLRNRARLVSKDDLIDNIWQGRIVSESSLTTRVNAARKAVGDSGEEQRVIRTVPRKGFRFVAEVSEDGTAIVSDVPLRYGGYSRSDYAYIVGRYFCHRRSFLTGRNITRSLLDIRWNDAVQALSFVEQVRYVSDAGVEQVVRAEGEIYMHLDRALMTLLAIDEGEVRVTMLNVPERRSTPGSRRLRGVLLTHGYPKSFYQPVVSAVTIELVPAEGEEGAEQRTGTIEPSDPDFARLDRDIRQAEENAVVMTPLLARMPA
ncbi:transcriptional regulator [Bosea sp. 685]|uniref:winged helix-turn-helix domain-containing protein n=1 Tax=Bosea sp. 685 TaxID=3080057 RepID=UPI00289327E1|nr:transcriptional regulator [Bosea sp. 685]WNJ88283.1 transcriptional regulator [Bosea sp. 685]